MLFPPDTPRLGGATKPPSPGDVQSTGHGRQGTDTLNVSRKQKRAWAGREARRVRSTRDPQPTRCEHDEACTDDPREAASTLSTSDS